MSQVFRSVLYIPGSKQRALEKACDLDCDAIIFDLEDAVAPDEKGAARETLAQALKTLNYGDRAVVIRINSLDSGWGRDDIAAMLDVVQSGARIDALLVPKVNSPADLTAVHSLAPGMKLWAMMETCFGMLNAATIAAHPALAGMVMGTNDLAKELGSRNRADRLPMQTGLGLCLLAGRAYGLVMVDGVYNAFKDEAGLEFECEQGRDLGFDGKSVIHPAQLAVANRVFAPSAAEIDLATRQIAAFEAVLAQGGGVAVLDGKIVENLHVVSAKAILAKAKAIASRG